MKGILAGKSLIDGSVTESKLSVELQEKINDRGLIAGRYWDDTDPSPTAAGYYGSLWALQNLPARLGLGRYLVLDDRRRKKLDPLDSTKFVDGTPAALDGTMGQCMWGWNAHYYTSWTENNYTIEAVSFEPIYGKNSIYVPEGGISWMDVGVMDRETQTLVSVVSEDERYRGGSGVERSTEDYPLLIPGSPQQTLLGMYSGGYSIREAGEMARKHGEGWESCWYVNRSVVEYLPRIILGTRRIQTDYNPELDENGLYQGGMGIGMCGWDDEDRSVYGPGPFLPTKHGLEMGDRLGLCEPLDIYTVNGDLLHSFSIPSFFGLINAGYGNVWKGVRGLILQNENRIITAYVKGSIYQNFNDNSIEGLLKVGVLPDHEGWITKMSYHYLAGIPLEAEGTSYTYYGDWYWYYPENTGNNIRLTSGRVGDYYTLPGPVCCYSGYKPTATSGTGSLCYLKEDPNYF